MNSSLSPVQQPVVALVEDDDGPQVGLVDLLTWLGERKRLVGGVTATVAVLSAVASLLMPDVYTARTTLLPPNSQQQSSSAAALAALGSLGGLAGGIAGKSPDEMYTSLLRSDTVQRALDEKFKLRDHYDVKTYEVLRTTLPRHIRIAADKKSSVITVEVDDEDPKFAADLANAHSTEITRLLGRLAVTEAQQRRVFFEQQLKDAKENLIKAEQNLRQVQETSGMVVLDKQAEALIEAAARLRARIAEREVQLKVLRTSSTAQNPDVLRIVSELGAMRSELARMESSAPAAAGASGPGAGGGSALDIPIARLPSAAVDYVRAMREVKFQETLLGSMLRQFEVAKLDEAKDAPALQQVDVALPPDRKSKPKRAGIVLGATFAAFFLTSLWVIVRRYLRLAREQDPERATALDALRRAWRLRG